MGPRVDAKIISTRVPNSVLAWFRQRASDRGMTTRDLITDAFGEIVIANPWPSLTISVPAGITKSSAGWAQVNVEARPGDESSFSHAWVRYNETSPVPVSKSALTYSALLWYVARQLDVDPRNHTAVIEAATKAAGLTLPTDPIPGIRRTRGPSKKTLAARQGSQGPVPGPVAPSAAFVAAPVAREPSGAAVGLPGAFPAIPGANILVVYVVPGRGARLSKKIAQLDGVVDVRPDAAVIREMIHGV